MPKTAKEITGEIREEMAHLCSKGMKDCDYDCEHCKELTNLLRSWNGKVKIHMERELPECPISYSEGQDSGFRRIERYGYLKGQTDMLHYISKAYMDLEVEE